MMKLLLIFLSFFLSLEAHQLRENYLHVDYNASTQTLLLSLEVETRLLENEKIMDDNNNGIISYRELQNHINYLTSYVRQHCKFYITNKRVSLNDAEIVFHRYQDQTYMQITKLFHHIDLNNLSLRYDMFFELEKNHKLLIHLDTKRGDAILDTHHREYHFSNFEMSQTERLYLFVKTGVHHILDGLDHLLFVLMILMPSVIKGIRYSLVDILKIITTFSIAHSLTLFISGIGLYRPNTTFIESAIALSIFIVAYMNFRGEYAHVNKKIVFLFGLLHGFGFANVLEIAQVKDTLSFLVALFGFNLGVEIGQIFVIALLLPFLMLISLSIHKYKVVTLISFCALLLSGYWFIQRVGLV